MEQHKIYNESTGTTTQYSVFMTEGGVVEYHAILQVERATAPFAQQLQAISDAELALLRLPELRGAQPIFKRYFLSDAANQVPVITGEQGIDSIQAPDMQASISYIQQPPLNGSKIAAWVYLQRGTDVSKEGQVTVVSHNGYRHLWLMGLHHKTGDSYTQTQQMLASYKDTLSHYGANIADHCIRTWFFVRDVDTQYAGMVKARREFFTDNGLTQHTHYISSTGIGGTPCSQRAILQLGTYAVTGIQPQQQHYLYAPTHLNPTYEYGVTFERGTVVEYGDRRQIFISGTASINNKGEVMHIGDIRKQTLRMWENVEQLLAEGEATYDDVMQIIVYLRDTADYQVVQEMFSKRFPDTPYVITLAPVCRPTWLIEMECIAVTGKGNSKYASF